MDRSGSTLALALPMVDNAAVVTFEERMGAARQRRAAMERR